MLEHQRRTAGPPVGEPGARVSGLALTPADRVLRLQRTAGNRAVVARLALMRDAGAIGIPADRYHLLDQPAGPTHPGVHLLDHELDQGDADRWDFNMIRKMGKGVATRHGEPVRTLDEYLRVRRSVFGDKHDSPEEADKKYWAFAGESDEEFAAHKELHQWIEPGPGSPDVQAHFYRWVRKKFIDGGDNDVPAAIKRGMEGGAKLKATVEAEWKALGHPDKIRPQGPNPRTMKSPTGLYELGTLSEHAKGAAVDIDPDHNPFFYANQWSVIESVAGVTEHRDPKVWKALWHKDPKALWTKIKAINDAFVANLPKLARDEQMKIDKLASRHHLVDASRLRAPAVAGLSAPPASGPGSEKLSLGPMLADAADVAVSDQAALAVLGNDKKLFQFRHGFLTLDGDLVERLGKRGLVWGAIFSERIDLQHFELE